MDNSDVDVAHIIEQPISRLKPGEHLCCIYEEDHQFLDTLSAFLAEGLTRKQKVLYIYNERAPEEVEHQLASQGNTVQAARENGRLVFHSYQDLFGASGAFDPQGLMNWIAAEIASALSGGYTALRLALEMSPAGEAAGGADAGSAPAVSATATSALSQFESQLSEPGGFSDAIILCLYDRRRFDPAFLVEAMILHPSFVEGAVVYQNDYHMPASVFHSQRQEATYNELLLTALISRQKMQRQLGTVWSDIEVQLGRQLAALSMVNQQLSQEVSQRVKAEMALRETENRYRTIFDVATDAIYIHDIDGRFLEVNPVACERLGYLREELIGKTPDLITVPELASQLAVRVALLRQFGVLTYETVELTKSGEMIPVEVNARLTDYEAGLAIISISRDITDRKHAELTLVNLNEALASTNEALEASNAALRASELKFRSLVETSPYGVALVDEDGILVEFNAANEAIFGLPAEQALGKSVIDYFFNILPLERRTDATLEKIRAEVQKFIQTGASQELGAARVHEIVSPEGERRYLQVTAFPIRTDRSYMIGIITRDETAQRRADLELQTYREHLETIVSQRTAQLRREIRERQQVQQALVETNSVLRESEERYRALVNQSPVSIMVVQDGRYVLVNPAGARLLGYDNASTLEGMDIMETIAAESREDMRTRIERVSRWQINEPMILQFVRKDGGILYSETSSVPILFKGRQAALVIGQDISERFHHQQQLEASLAEKEVMLREIHHRVKNNLNVIIALINLQKGAQTDPQVQQVFKELETRAYSMALVHENLYRSPNLARVDFSGYLQTLISYLGTAYGPPGSPLPVSLRVEADNVDLKIEKAIPCGLIINELVTNSLKYAFPAGFSLPEGQAPEVLVRLERTALERVQEDGASAVQINLFVGDNGAGLPGGLEWQSATTLGLQLVKILARQLGGTDELIDSPGVTWRVSFWEGK